MEIGTIFEDGGFKYKVVGIHELGYAISTRITDDKPITVSKSVDKPKYTKTQINRMSTSDLEKLSFELDLPIGTGAEMKKALIEALEL